MKRRLRRQLAKVGRLSKEMITRRGLRRLSGWWPSKSLASGLSTEYLKRPRGRLCAPVLVPRSALGKCFVSEYSVRHDLSL